MKIGRKINKSGFKVLVFVLLILAAFLGNSKYKQWQAHKALEIQIQALREEAERIDNQNAQLEKSLDILVSDQANEKIARMQLNMKKAGETSIVFLEEENEPQESVEKKQDSNLKIWWDYFFKQD